LALEHGQRSRLQSARSAGTRLSDPSGRTFRHELARKAIHLLSAVFPLIYAAGVPRRFLLYLLAAASVVAIAVEIGRARHARTRELFHQATGALLRPHEHTQLSGATWLVLAFLGSVALYPPPVAIAAMWAVGVGDAAAALVGHPLGRHRIGRSGKTLEGAIACLVATFPGALLIARLSVPESIVAAAAAAVAEAPHRPFDDNVRIAIAVGGGILLWRMVFS
jgi:dolichol kinase